MSHLGECAYTAFAKELHRVTGIASPEWNKLRSEQMRSWHHAANNVVARVAAFGFPRPLDALEDAREAKRCAEWLLHVADGGDVGGSSQMRALLRSAAGLLAHHASRADADGDAASALREYLSVHPVGGHLTGKEIDALALGLARVALEFQAPQSTEMLEFVEFLRAWHAKKVSNLRDVQAGSKEGTLLKVGDDNDGMPMSKREALFFKLGVEASLIELGTLPFTVTPDVGADLTDDED
ncbi:hypothetical protein C380_18215 [Acidovorax sp. KKS102]|nr:hypothetical protein C380_18215 [Acidovorax sp. KKS102]